MSRKFTRYLFAGVLWFTAVQCQDDDIAAPPKPSLEADKSTAQVGETVTFTIDAVNADAVSLLPYGLPGNDPGIPLSFSNGTASVEFTYARPGTFDAVVVANNHTSDGESIENVRSEPVTITVTSSENAISAFRFIRINETETAFEVVDVSTATAIDQDAGTITVTVPYGADVESLTAAFTAPGYATVEVGGVEQTTEESVNNFSNPVVYTVTADDGTTRDYTVTVNVTPVETITTIKSISATAVSVSAEEKDLPVFVDNTNHRIVVYDEFGTADDQFDSVRIGYALDGAFAILKYGDSKMKQDSMLDLTAVEEVEVYSQDSTSAGGIQAYSIYAVDAPELTLSFPGLNPDPAADVEPSDFAMNIPVLEGTDVNSISTVASVNTPSGVTVTSISADGALLAGGTGNVDYSAPVEFELEVADTNLGITYTVVYTVTVTVVP